MKLLIKVVVVCIFVVGTTCCSKGSGIDNEPTKEPEIKENIDGVRISWDYSTLTKIAPAAGKTEGYCGYARLEQLHDGRLACVYETSSGNTELAFSDDLGETWGEPQIVFATQNSISMAVPDIIELTDHSLLVACNPRPRKPYTDDRKFGIKVRKSTDGGQSWQKQQTVYQAQSTFNDGCWEPCFAQLPNGEVQLFFANEGTFLDSNEQNISMLRSTDWGDSWSEQVETIGFRQDRRDGMPVPLVLEDKGEILVAVEDNKVGEFKPTIYHEKISDNWNDRFISGTDSRRDYQPLENILSDDIYAGAPFLARLSTGEVLLSYQSTENRSDIWDRSCMVVEIGNDAGAQFKNRTVPFEVPLTKSGLWNSISVIENGTVPVAVTSTNAYSYNSTEVWMIKGQVIPEFTIPESSVSLDGNLSESCWENFPYFLGHEGETQLRASLTNDAENIYLALKIENSDKISQESTINFQIDTERKGYNSPHSGIFSFKINMDGSIETEEGNSGEWHKIETKYALQLQLKNNNGIFTSELKIPLDLLKIELEDHFPIGINFTFDYQTKSGTVVKETIEPNNPEEPFTWCPAWIN